MQNHPQDTNSVLLQSNVALDCNTPLRTHGLKCRQCCHPQSLDAAQTLVVGAPEDRSDAINKQNTLKYLEIHSVLLFCLVIGESRDL